MPLFTLKYTLGQNRRTHICKALLSKVSSDEQKLTDALTDLYEIDTTQKDEDFLQNLKSLRVKHPFINKLCGAKGFKTIFYKIFGDDTYKADRYKTIINAIKNCEFTNNNKKISYFKNEQLHSKLHEKLQSIKDKYVNTTYQNNERNQKIDQYNFKLISALQNNLQCELIVPKVTKDDPMCRSQYFLCCYPEYQTLFALSKNPNACNINGDNFDALKEKLMILIGLDKNTELFDNENNFTDEVQKYMFKCLNVQIQYMKNNLSIEVTNTFKSLLNIQSIGDVEQNSPVAVGDLDGSHARLILAGIQTGKITLTIAGFTNLCTLLNNEAEAGADAGTYEANKHKLKQYQESKNNQDLLNNIVQSITYHKTDIPLIFIGDMVHDRFNLNKRIELQLREALYKTENVIFIKGNHDSYEEYRYGLYKFSEKCGDYSQCGDYSKKHDIQDNQFQEHEKRYFQNTYYHEDTNTLYIHNGLEQRNNKIITAYGTIEATSIEDFVTKMNAQQWDKMNLTDYRPEMKNKQFKGIFRDVRIVHGHNDVINVDPKAQVIGINARNHNEDFTAVAIRIGKKDKNVAV